MNKEAGKNKKIGPDNLAEFRKFLRNIAGTPAIVPFYAVDDSRDTNPENNKIVERQQEYQIELRPVEAFVFREIRKVDIDVQIE